MTRYTDEDGVDGPFDRAMRAAMHDDAKRLRPRVAPMVRCPLCEPGPVSYAGVVLNIVCARCQEEIRAARPNLPESEIPQ